MPATKSNPVPEITSIASARRPPPAPDFGAISADLDRSPLSELGSSPRPPLSAVVSAAGGGVVDAVPSTTPETPQFDAVPEVKRAWRPVAAVRLLAAAGGVAAAAAIGIMTVYGLATQSETGVSEGSTLPIGGETGVVVVESNPPGAEVIVDGVRRGNTPLELSLPVGNRQVEIRREDRVRTMPVAVSADRAAAHYFDFSSAAVPAEKKTTGRLDITSEPAGASVRIDGVARGTTPLTLSDVAAGERRIVLTGHDATVTRTVRVAAGGLSSVVVSMSPAAGAGWVALKAPFEMQIFEAGRLLGTTAAERLMLPAGRHELELVSAPLAFRTQIAVTVANRETVVASVPVPNGTLSINALPWAEVWVDDRPVGTTPLANVSVRIGSHQVTYRHPQLGERRAVVMVTADAPARIGVDLRQ